MRIKRQEQEDIDLGNPFCIFNIVRRSNGVTVAAKLDAVLPVSDATMCRETIIRLSRAVGLAAR